MILLALDQSSRITGYSIFDTDTEKLIKSGVFKTKGTELQKRLEQIRNWVKQIIQEEKIDKVILEDIQLESTVSNNVVTYKALAEVIGVITELLQELKIPFELVHAVTWRKELSLKGNKRSIQKENAKNYVSSKYKQDFLEDESEAICIGTYYIQKNKMAFDWS